MPIGLDDKLQHRPVLADEIVARHARLAAEQAIERRLHVPHPGIVQQKDIRRSRTRSLVVVGRRRDMGDETGIGLETGDRVHGR
jgi:hypothetical protein